MHNQSYQRLREYLHVAETMDMLHMTQQHGFLDWIGFSNLEPHYSQLLMIVLHQ